MSDDIGHLGEPEEFWDNEMFSTGDRTVFEDGKLRSWLRRDAPIPPPLCNEPDVEIGTLDQISESNHNIVFEQAEDSDSDDNDDDENVTVKKDTSLSTLGQIASSGDIVFEHVDDSDDDETDSWDDPLALPLHEKPDIERPDPFGTLEDMTSGG